MKKVNCILIEQNNQNNKKNLQNYYTADLVISKDQVIKNRYGKIGKIII